MSDCKMGTVEVGEYWLELDEPSGVWSLNFTTGFGELIEIKLAFDKCFAAEIAARMLTALDPDVELARWLLEGAVEGIESREYYKRFLKERQ